MHIFLSSQEKAKCRDEENKAENRNMCRIWSCNKNELSYPQIIPSLNPELTLETPGQEQEQLCDQHS